MDDKTKKILVSIVAVTAVIVAGTITVRTFSGGGSNVDSVIENIPDEDMFPMICHNPQCGHRGEMPRKEYLKETRRLAVELNSRDIPPLKCPKCGQDSYYMYREQR